MYFALETGAIAVGVCRQLASAGYTGSIAVSGKSPFYTGACSAARFRFNLEPGFIVSLLVISPPCRDLSLTRGILCTACLVLSSRQLRSCGLPGQLRGQQRAEWLRMQSRQGMAAVCIPDHKLQHGPGFSSPGYSGKITATSSSPFYSGTCVETCALFTCPKGHVSRCRV